MTIYLAIVLPPGLSYEGDSYLPEFDVLDELLIFGSRLQMLVTAKLGRHSRS